MDYMQEDDQPAVPSGSTSRPNPTSSSSSSPNTWRAPERKKGNMKQTRRLDDMMDLEQNTSSSGSSSTARAEQTKQAKGKSVVRGGGGAGSIENDSMEIERERQHTGFPPSLSSSLPMASSSLANAMNPATSTAPNLGNRNRGHLRGASRSHVIPVYNNDPTGSRGSVPLPASTGGTINTTLNTNGTVTVTRSAMTPSKNHGRRDIGSSPSSSPFTSTDSQNPDAVAGVQDGVPGGFDIKGLMSPPTPAPSPTPGRIGWWGTVARDAGEGEVPGQANREEAMSRFDPAQLLMSFPSLPPPTRLRLLEDLLPLLSTPELLMLNSNIGPRLKRDFLKELPVELGLHVLSFIDDPMTLARASLVSKHWYRLLQDEKTWKNMCARHRFQTAEILPAIPALTQRNVSEVAILSRNRPGSSEAMVIPSSTNRIAPQFEVANPRMFSASRVGRGDGLVYGADEEEEEDPHQGYPVILPEHAPMQFNAQPHGATDEQTSAQGNMGSVVSPRRRNVGLAQADSDTQNMPGAYQITSTPSGSSIDPAQQAHYTGQINGQLPPMPSIISPSAVTNTGFQNHFGLGLDTGDTRAAQQSASGLPFTSLSTTSRGLGTIEDMELDPQHDDVANGILTSGGMLASTSSMSGYGRSHSVPEPILLQGKRQPSYGTKKPEEVDTEAPGFSYKNHFKKAYLTESNWLRGGRLLSTHTSTDEGVVTTLAMNAKYIIIGMANTRIHLFEADRGKFIRSFDGHDLGVWALYLVTSGAPPSEALDSDDAEWDGESNFNIGSYTRERDAPNRQKARKRPRSDTRRASLGEPSYSAPRGSQSSHTRNGSSSRPGQRHPPGSYNPNGPFGPRYPGTESSGKRLQSSDVANSAYGWGQKKELVISGGCDRDVKVWDIATGECLHTMHGHTSTIRCLKVLDGRPVAVTGARDATIRVWDIERGVLLHNLTGHTHSVRCLEIAGHYCVSGSYDCTARVWDLETGECLQVLRGHYHQIYDIAFDGEKVATGSLDSTVRIWSAVTGECIALLQGHTSLVGQLQLSGDILVTGGSDGRVIIFDLSTYTCLQRICAHDNSVTSLQFDDRFILSGGNDGRVKLWDIKTGNFIRELSKPSEAVWKVTFKNDKCAVLCKRNNKTVLELLSFVPEEFSI